VTVTCDGGDQQAIHPDDRQSFCCRRYQSVMATPSKRTELTDRTGSCGRVRYSSYGSVTSMIAVSVTSTIRCPPAAR
jgi:hypothetical protein